MRRQRGFLVPCGTPSGGSISYSQLQNTTQNIIRIVEKDGQTDRHADRQDKTRQNKTDGQTDRYIYTNRQITGRYVQTYNVWTECLQLQSEKKGDMGGAVKEIIK